MVERLRKGVTALWADLNTSIVDMTWRDKWILTTSEKVTNHGRAGCMPKDKTISPTRRNPPLFDGSFAGPKYP